MATLTGLFRRGGSYYLRVVLPHDHPLKSTYRNGRLVQTLGPGSYREAVRKGTLKRAEVLLGYRPQAAPTSGPSHEPVFLRKVYERWLASTPRTSDTAAACRRALEQYEAQLGNPPLQSLTRAQGDAFKGFLQTLGTSSKTARDRLVWIKSLLKYAHRDLEVISRNPWEGLDIPVKTTRRRRPWEPSELQALFSQPLHVLYHLPRSKKAGADAAYWLPLLGLFSGARLGELAQLTVADVTSSGGIPVLSITDEAAGQLVKTEASIRKIPVHPELIRLGFLDYVAHLKIRRQTRLWPGLPLRNGKPGGYFSQWFGEYRRTLSATELPDFHSLRHTVRSQLAAAGLEEPIIDTLLGHEVSGSTGARVYTHRSMSILAKAITEIQYPSLLLERVYQTDNSPQIQPARRARAGGGP